MLLNVFIADFYQVFAQLAIFRDTKYEWVNQFHVSGLFLSITPEDITKPLVLCFQGRGGEGGRNRPVACNGLR